MNDEIKRWTILTLDLISATVTVSDTELKKNKTYHIMPAHRLIIILTFRLFARTNMYLAF